MRGENRQQQHEQQGEMLRVKPLYYPAESLSFSLLPVCVAFLGWFERNKTKMAAVTQRRSCSDKEEQEKVVWTRLLQSSTGAHWLPYL